MYMNDFWGAVWVQTYQWRVFYCFEVVKFPQKHPIFTFGVVKTPHMIGLRPFCAPEFIQLYKNLIFCLLVIVKFF